MVNTVKNAAINDLDNEGMRFLMPGSVQLHPTIVWDFQDSFNYMPFLRPVITAWPMGYEPCWVTDTTPHTEPQFNLATKIKRHMP